MKNTQNCRIGWITDPRTGDSIRITMCEGKVFIEENFIGSSENVEFLVSVTAPSVNVLAHRYPYHPLLRRLNTQPTKTQVHAWGNPNIYNTTQN